MRFRRGTGYVSGKLCGRDRVTIGAGWAHGVRGRHNLGWRATARHVQEVSYGGMILARPQAQEPLKGACGYLR